MTKLLLFSMSTFESLMDRAEEIYMSGDVPSLYTDRTREDPWTRWFAYDLTRNHLRHYLDHEMAAVPIMDNRKGPRWTLYPEFMKIISSSIVVSTLDEYQNEDVYRDADDIGIVGDFEHSLPLYDPKLDYLDILDISKVTEVMGSVFIIPQTSKKLRHLHIQTSRAIERLEERVVISGFIEYLSIDIRYECVYMGQRMMWLTIHNLRLRYLQIGEVLVNPGIVLGLVTYRLEYLDITTIRARNLALTEIIRHISDESRLSHLGFRPIRRNFDWPSNSYTSLIPHLDKLPKLTSLAISSQYGEIEHLNGIVHQLIYLELKIHRRTSCPHRLFIDTRSIRVLHLENVSDVIDAIKSCRVLSLYSSMDILELNIDYLRANLPTDLNSVMINYRGVHDELRVPEGAWFGTSNIPYPADISTLHDLPDRTVAIWDSPPRMSISEILGHIKYVASNHRSYKYHNIYRVLQNQLVASATMRG